MRPASPTTHVSLAEALQTPYHVPVPLVEAVQWPHPAPTETSVALHVGMGAALSLAGMLLSATGADASGVGVGEASGPGTTTGALESLFGTVLSPAPALAWPDAVSLSPPNRLVQPTIEPTLKLTHQPHNTFFLFICIFWSSRARSSLIRGGHLMASVTAGKSARAIKTAHRERQTERHGTTGHPQRPGLI